MKIRMLFCMALLSFWSAPALVQAQTVAQAEPGCCDQVFNGCNGSCAGGCNGCGAAASCDAGGCARCGHYVSMFGGWTDWASLDANLGVSGILAGTASADVQTKDGYAVGTAFGRYMNFNLRSELEFAYRNNSLDNVVLSAAGLGSVTADLDGKINAYSGMYNLYYDLGSIGQTPLRPYVGAGAGFAFLNYDISSPALPGVGLSINDSTFAYQGIIGLGYQLSDRINLFTEYRIFGTTGFDATLSAPGVPLTASLDMDGYTHNIFVGARISVR